MCWFSDCRELRTKYKELRDVNYELESNLKKVTRTRDDLALMCEGLRKLVSEPEVGQWIDVRVQMPKDGQRVNVVAQWIPEWRVPFAYSTIADYCACKGWIQPYLKDDDTNKKLRVHFWSPIPELTEEIKSRA